MTMIAPACEEHAATSRRSFSLIPLTPFSHKGRRGSLGVLMAETGDGAQGIAKTSTPERSPDPLPPARGRRGELGFLMLHMRIARPEGARKRSICEPGAPPSPDRR